MKIGFDHENAFIRSMKHHLGELKRDDFSLRSDSDLAQLAALRAGFGIGICQVGIARRNPALVRLLPDAFAPRLDTWLAMHEDLRNSRRCSVVFSALADGLAAYMDS
jgi:DNA-binding transcriptional LysR family regulator